MPISEFHTRTLTRVINEMKSPQSWLKTKFFGSIETVDSEFIELSSIHQGRVMAPFVKINGEGSFIQGTNAKTFVVRAPYLRPKMQLEPEKIAFERQPGEPIHTTGEARRAAIRAYMARELASLEKSIANREEWMCGQIMDKAVLSYSVEGFDSFTITLPRPAGHDVTLAAPWDLPETDPNLEEFVLTVKKLMNDEHDLPITDCVMGDEAAAAFRKLVKSNDILKEDLRIGRASRLDAYEADYNLQGVLYLGRLFGIDWWEYARTIADSDTAGTARYVIRPKRAVFVSNTPAAEKLVYYAFVPDMRGLGTRSAQPRFSKTWEIEEPSTRILLAASRPLPFMRRAGASITVKAVSGVES
jgi:hypothetical protein